MKATDHDTEVPAPGDGRTTTGRLAYEAARTAIRLSPSDGPAVLAPAWLPVLAAPDRARPHPLRVLGPAQPGHVDIYAAPVKTVPTDTEAAALWDRVAEFGAGTVYATIRSLQAAILTARATAVLPDRAAHLDALRRHWLVRWTCDGGALHPAGAPASPELLDDLAKAVDACHRAEDCGLTDGDLLAWMWERLAGPGERPLNRREIQGERLLLTNVHDTYLADRSRPMPRWTVPPTPEEALLAALPGPYTELFERGLAARDRAVFRAWASGAGTWAQAAAEAAPDAEPDVLGQRVRRMMLRFARETARRHDARTAGRGDR